MYDIFDMQPPLANPGILRALDRLIGKLSRMVERRLRQQPRKPKALAKTA